MATQTEQLESLNTHRQFFYLLSLYGCYDKYDLKNVLNRSKTTIDTEIRLLKYYIEESRRVLRQGSDKTLTYDIPYHRYAPCENQLVNLFRQKNFTTKQMNYDFLLLMVLMKHKQPLSLTQLLEGIQVISDLSFFTEEDTLSQDKVRETMEELVLLDFVTETKEKNKKMYKIKENINLSTDHWIRIHEALDFFRNDGFFNSLGYFCQENIEENLYHQKKSLPTHLESPFAYKRHFPHNILEDDLALTLMEAWEECRCITFKYNGDGEGKPQSYKVVPLKILSNPGRNHLFAFDLKENKPISIPLWRLEQVKKGKDTFLKEDYTATLALLDKSWSMTRLHLVGDPLNAPTKRVELDFYPDAHNRILDQKPALWHRLQREKRQGLVTMEEDAHYSFSIDLLEPLEMIPWIRSFGAQVVVRPSTEHQLSEVLERHRKELAQAYGLISPT